MKDPLTPIADTIKKSWAHLLFSVALLGAAITALCVGAPKLAVAQVVVTDLYVLLMLWSATQLSAHRRADGKADPAAETWPGTPRRDGALLVLGLLLAAVVIGFAALYAQEGWLAESASSSRHDSLYFSLITITTVGFGDLHPLTADAKTSVMLQVASGFLFLAAAIPILASRLAQLD
jgi:hypothetical protein